jgi:hypothetical protein
MQPECYDYSEDEEGCCLNCDEASDGCLCYECKCTKCYNYTYSQFDYGFCDIAMANKVNSRKKSKVISEYFSKTTVYDYSKIGLNPKQKQIKEFNEEKQK